MGLWLWVPTAGEERRLRRRGQKKGKRDLSLSLGLVGCPDLAGLLPLAEGGSSRREDVEVERRRLDILSE